MILDKHTAMKTAEFLLQINAIKLQPQQPFVWASGWKAPIYCDNRIVLSYPRIRNFLRDQFAKQIEQLYGKPAIIAGVATGAIGIGMLVAQIMELPFIYVRPEAKKHGRQNQIEGVLEEGQTVVVVEDLISTGKSSLNAVEALRQNGANVKGMLAIFTYGFEIASDNFKNNKIELHTLSNYNFILEQALQTNYINQDQLKVLSKWNKNPDTWQPL